MRFVVGKIVRHRGAWLLALLPVLLAVLRVKTSTPSAVAKVAEPSERHALYALIVANEPAARREVVKDFPADPWSQDDAFHEREFQRARTTASNRGVRLMDALIGLDEGLRAAKPGRYRATVPPCRPRTIY